MGQGLSAECENDVCAEIEIHGQVIQECRTQDDCGGDAEFCTNVSTDEANQVLKRHVCYELEAVC